MADKLVTTNDCSLETMIETMIREYPYYVANRTDALERLYCILGAGFDWHDGAIVSCVPIEGKFATLYDSTELEKALDRFNGLELPTDIAEHVAQMRENVEKEKKLLARLAIISSECAQRAQEKPVPAFIYPLHGSSSYLITDVPNDVRQDWLDGAYEVLDLIEKIDGSGPFPGVLNNTCARDDEERLKSWFESRESTLKVAQDVGKDLDRRFPGRKAHR